MPDAGDPSSDTSSDGPTADRRRFGRRNFFRTGLRELLRPVVAVVDERLTALNDVLPVLPRKVAVSLALLRPPGALAEADFLATCVRCGACATACPADAIRIEPGVAGGAPFIDADRAPCVVCTTLECMMVCPSGALVPTPIKFIDMGTARWDPNACLRPRGEDCRVCVDECPIGEVAIRLDATGRVAVNDDGCVGCGVCQNRCPTSPKSIVVEPKGMRVGVGS